MLPNVLRLGVVGDLQAQRFANPKIKKEE